MLLTIRVGPDCNIYQSRHPSVLSFLSDCIFFLKRHGCYSADLMTPRGQAITKRTPATDNACQVEYSVSSNAFRVPSQLNS